MQRIRGDFVALVKPAYDDPSDPLVSDSVGYFNKDPLQAATPLTQDWATRIQEELCNLVEGLGGTLDDQSDNQLAELFKQGTFTPVFADVADPDFTYIDRQGFYQRIGGLVYAQFVIEWTNADDGLIVTDAAIKAPYALLSGTQATGVLDFAGSFFGTAGSGFTTAALRFTDSAAGIRVLGRATTMDSTTRHLSYGDEDQRVIAGSIWYRTDGSFNY